jgi:DNA-directed RNA polymerase specialized sigma24 family protein
VAAEGVSPDEEILNRERRQLAARILLALPKYCRRLWGLIFLGNRNYKQAAEVLGVAEGTVKRQMWQCRKLAQKQREIYEK